MKIIWSPLALVRIQEIAAYIAEDNPEAARMWVERVVSSVRNLSEFPESGPRGIGVVGSGCGIGVGPRQLTVAPALSPPKLPRFDLKSPFSPPKTF